MREVSVEEIRTRNITENRNASAMEWFVLMVVILNEIIWKNSLSYW